MKLPDRISLSVPQTGVGGLWFASVFLGMGSVVSSKEPGRVDFNRDIRPILSEHCYHCHGPDAETRDADLRLDIEAEAKKDLGGYFALVPGKPEDSEIWLRIDHDDPDEVMPPPKAKRNLTPEKKELFRRW
ncbi:MAG: hypothetical protein KDM64_15150, partial [Verrucomicrobiae bacterium]|nr:hypothetical protein [Verrucomicrobiae bacterium]